MEAAIFDEIPGNESSSAKEAELIFNNESGGAFSSTQLTLPVIGIDRYSLKPDVLLLYRYSASAQIMLIRQARKTVSYVFRVIFYEVPNVAEMLAQIPAQYPIFSLQL